MNTAKCASKQICNVTEYFVSAYLIVCIISLWIAITLYSYMLKMCSVEEQRIIFKRNRNLNIVSDIKKTLCDLFQNKILIMKNHFEKIFL